MITTTWLKCTKKLGGYYSAAVSIVKSTQNVSRVTLFKVGSD
jgi:hypothetical protein